MDIEKVLFQSKNGYPSRKTNLSEQKQTFPFSAFIISALGRKTSDTWLSCNATDFSQLKQVGRESQMSASQRMVDLISLH
jgi:hypothetical protein